MPLRVALQYRITHVQGLRKTSNTEKGIIILNCTQFLKRPVRMKWSEFNLEQEVTIL